MHAQDASLVYMALKALAMHSNPQNNVLMIVRSQVQIDCRTSAMQILECQQEMAKGQTPTAGQIQVHYSNLLATNACSLQATHYLYNQSVPHGKPHMLPSH